MWSSLATTTTLVLAARVPSQLSAGRRNRVPRTDNSTNPRFSASTHLRSLAGFNELDIYLRAMLNEEVPGPTNIRKGWYLRSLTEKYVAPEAIKS